MDYRKLTHSRSEFPIIIAVTTVCFATVFGIAVYGLLKVNKLEIEIDALKSKYNGIEESLSKDVKCAEDVKPKPDDDSNFEYQLDDVSFEDYGDYYPDVYAEPYLDKDANDVYEDEDREPTKSAGFSSADGAYEDYDSENDLEDKLTQVLLTGGSFTKIGTEKERQKRDILATTADGILINSEPYAAAKNRSSGKNTLKIYSQVKPRGGDGVHSPIPVLHERYNSPSYATRTPPQFRNIEGGSIKPTPILARKSRVMHVDDKTKAFRRVIKKPVLKSADGNYQEHSGSPEVTIIRDVTGRRRRHRQRRVETFGESVIVRVTPAIQLNGEVLQSAYGVYENFLGNGRLHHYDRHFINWTRDDWVQNLGMEQYFQVSDGYLTILESGLYVIYAQIFYIDEHDTNGFRVYKNENMILQCTTTSHTSHRIDKPNTCYTAGVEYIAEGDRLRVHDMEANRYSVFEPGKSFFGAIKLADARIK